MAKAAIYDKTSGKAYRFSVNPNRMSWSYVLNSHVTPTYGGQVVQVLSCKMDTLTVEGYIPRKGDQRLMFESMERFERSIKALMDMQYDVDGRGQILSNHLWFKFSPFFDNPIPCFLTGYSNVSYDAEMGAVTYTLKLQPDKSSTKVDTGGSGFFGHVKGGVEWVRDKYNEPNFDSDDAWTNAKKALKQLLNDAGTSFFPKSLYELMDSQTDDAQDDQVLKSIEKNAKKWANVSTQVLKYTGKKRNRYFSNLAKEIGFKGSAKELQDSLDRLMDRGSVQRGRSGGFYYVSSVGAGDEDDSGSTGGSGDKRFSGTLKIWNTSGVDVDRD